MRKYISIFLFFFFALIQLHASDSIRYHAVQSHENLFRLALNNKVSQEDIIRWNNLKSRTIVAGMRLIVWKKESSKIELKKATSTIKVVNTSEVIEDMPNANSVIFDSVARVDSLKSDSLQKQLVASLQDTISKNQHFFVLQSEIKDDRAMGIILKLINWFNRISLFVKLLIYFSFYFLLSIVVLVSFIAIKRYRGTKRQVLETHYREVYREQIASYLFEDIFLNKQTLAKEFKSDFHRELFLSELLILNRNMSGEIKGKIKRLYFELHLDKYSLLKARSNRWYRKAKGFSELALFEVFDCNDLIQEHVNDENPIVAAEAEIALVKLLPDKQFDFIKNIKNKISLWEQVNIYDTLKKHGIEPDTLVDCLQCENKSVVQFSLRLIGIYKQTEHFNEVMAFLNDEDSITRGIAIDTLGMLNSEEALDKLHQVYEKETIENKLKIVSALLNIQSESNLKFLENCLFEENFKISLNAAHSLAFHGEEGLDILNKHKENSQVNLVIKHALDKRI